MTATHSRFMKRALALALKGKGEVHPNPLVGCVLVKGGKIVGEGFHAKYGGPHAEVVALQDAGPKAKGATAYINLEPCTHWGKTPPCAPALRKAGIKEAYVSLKDPNPSVNGIGIFHLRRGGIRVHVGLEREAAEALNKSFFTWKREDRPYTILKMAISLDGKTASASGDSKWISSKESRKLVHTLRSESDAVLVGASTVVKDNPLLTSHGVGRDPIRIVLDPQLRTSKNLNLYSPRSPETWVITTLESSPGKAKQLENKGVKILREPLKSGSFVVRHLIRLLSKRNVSQLLIEGGGETAWSFISAGFVDEVLFFLAPLIIGGRDAKTAVEGRGIDLIKNSYKVKSMTVVQMGPDLVIRGMLR